MSSPYWVNIIGDIVNDVRNDADKPSEMAALAPYYDYGHPIDIVNELALKERVAAAKFPLIALLMDFREVMGEDMTIRSRTTDMTIIIMTNTTPDLTPDQRYDQNFSEILYPLYDLLIKHITNSKYFDTAPGLVSHDKYDRPHWGRTGTYNNMGNIGNDFIDAIEVQNLNLSLKLNNTCKKQYYGIQ